MPSRTCALSLAALLALLFLPGCGNTLHPSAVVPGPRRLSVHSRQAQ